jgi:hypothetical protein
MVEGDEGRDGEGDIRDGDNAPSTRKLAAYGASLVVFLVVLYVVLVVIGDDNDEPLSDPAELATLVRAAALGCEDFDEVPPEDLGDGPAVRAGFCTLQDGSEIVINVFDTEDPFETMAFSPEDCAALGAGEHAYASGPYWVVSMVLGPEQPTIDPVATKELADALEGEYRVVEC